jgi:phosphoribosylaminoimidazole-succinocarboxamide synthase
VCGIQLPEGLQNSSKLPKVIFTPSSKAEFGVHDENITLEKAASIMGKERMEEVSRTAIAVYERARDVAAKKGVILADTKFEFGIDANGALVLADEVLTPDSSRYWPASKYEVGRQQQSYDKQYVRDWLESVDYDKATPKVIPADVVARTTDIYLEIFRILTGAHPTL